MCVVWGHVFLWVFTFLGTTREGEHGTTVKETGSHF